MAQQILNCGSYEVWLDPGFKVNRFTLDTSTLGGPNVLDGDIDYYDVTEYVLSIRIHRGRASVTDTVDAGTASIVIDDINGDFTVVNSSSPYWNPDDDRLGFQPSRRVRILRDSELLFNGQMVEYSQEVTLDGQSTVTIRASDDLVRLQSINMNAHTPTEELSGARVTAVLDRPEVNLFTGVGERNIDAGLAPLGAYPVEAGASVSDYLGRIQTAEQGRIFVSRSGVFTAQMRAGRRQLGTPLAFSDVSDGGVPYSSFELRYQ